MLVLVCLVGLVANVEGSTPPPSDDEGPNKIVVGVNIGLLAVNGINLLRDRPNAAIGAVGLVVAAGSIVAATAMIGEEA